MNDSFKIGSLFSGVGLLELAVELATGGEVEYQAEISAFRREVLAYHWPNAVRFDDVRSVTASTAKRVDLICGGFPCTNVSNAGLRTGLEGEQSGLWFEYRRILEEMRPDFAFIENPRALEIRGLDQVLEGLDRLGYKTRRGRLAAGDPRGLGLPNVGAPHERQRIWILAYTDEERLRQLAERCERVEAERWNALDLDAGEEGLGDADAQRGDGRTDAAGIQSAEGTEVEQRHPVLADAQGSLFGSGDRSGMADASAGRREELGEAYDDHGRHALRHDDARRRSRLRDAAFRHIVDPDWCPRPDFRDPAWGEWLERNPGCEPGIPRAPDGVAGRLDRHRRIARVAAVGDSVALQAAYWGFRGLVSRRGQLGLWG